MPRPPIILTLLAIGLISCVNRATAHFQVLLPSTDIVDDQQRARSISISVSPIPWSKAHQ